MALERFKKAPALISFIGNFKGGTQTQAQALKTVCELNKAPCPHRLFPFPGCKKACGSVLQGGGGNVQAPFRPPPAGFGLPGFGSCLGDPW
eukprot:UN4969